jgi:maltooligosyltrehalose trehalohydrolase
MSDRAAPPLGAILMPGGRCVFRVWAPRAQSVHVRMLGSPERIVEMSQGDCGHYEAAIENVTAGTLYFYRLNGKDDRPDPASSHQPDSVHGASQIIDARFEWSDEHWPGIRLEECVFYEVHIGAFTEKGTFDAAIDQLEELRDLGVTVVEVMPVAQFPGTRNWGYDGVAPYAVQNSYGGPAAFKRFVNAAHEVGLGVALDVVYNHLGPEGNYLSEFGPYFTEKYHTPWGGAMNFDEPGSDQVRRYFIENALMWVDEFHIDALRLDAVHAIFDQSAYPFLHELSDAVHALAERLHRRVHVIAESDLNDPRLVRSPDVGGFGLDAQWSDDFHHALHALLTGERSGYYADFGSVRDVADAMAQGFVYDGRFSKFRHRRHGALAVDVPARRMVICIQNHDQVGNRMMGERLSKIVPFEALKLAAAATLCAPGLPLMFMGEEYGEENPFLYFVSHGDPELIKMVRKGRRGEFRGFDWKGDPPDPQEASTFRRSKLDRMRRNTQRGRALRDFYAALLEARRTIPALAALDRHAQEFTIDEKRRTLVVRRWAGDSEAVLAFNFSETRRTIAAPAPVGRWVKAVDSADSDWDGPGGSVGEAVETDGEVTVDLQPYAFALLIRSEDSMAHEREKAISHGNTP